MQAESSTRIAFDLCRCLIGSSMASSKLHPSLGTTFFYVNWQTFNLQSKSSSKAEDLTCVES